MGDMNATPRDWFEAARPHTWPNAIAPVVVGTGAAARDDGAQLGYALLALVVSLALIVGVNYANDYSDGVRGTDEHRTGPTRLTASGLARPELVKFAAFAAFGVAGIAGVALSLLTTPWLILVGLLCVAAAWFYTGGKNPYGYKGYGELAVFVFFGLVAVLGTQFTQLGWVTWAGVACAVGVGSISAAINLANNIRDIPTDTVAGKNTLAVTLGDERARDVFTVLTLVPFVVSLGLCVVAIPAVLSLAALPWALGSILVVRRGATGPALIPVLGTNGRAMLIWSILVAGGLAFAGA
ncbi:1,4-dihydroxy-2-naphthoate polyprenyltransferase [Corynebacterium aquatimens]|nr:1,4-dihydroxy-2-naphthoate polyprenyltransferase [Corynebacterium aquatimens]